MARVGVQPNRWRSMAEYQGVPELSAEKDRDPLTEHGAPRSCISYFRRMPMDSAKYRIVQLRSAM